MSDEKGNVKPGEAAKTTTPYPQEAPKPDPNSNQKSIGSGWFSFNFNLDWFSTPEAPTETTSLINQSERRSYNPYPRS